MERKNGAKTSLFIFNKKIRKRWFKKKEAFKTDLGFGRGDAPTPFEISDARIGFIDSVENNLIESFLMGLMVWWSWLVTYDPMVMVKEPICLWMAWQDWRMYKYTVYVWVDNRVGESEHRTTGITSTASTAITTSTASCTSVTSTTSTLNTNQQSQWRMYRRIDWTSRNTEVQRNPRSNCSFSEPT